MLKSRLIYRKLTADDSLAYREIRLESLREFPEAFGSNYKEQLAKSKLAFQGFLEQEADHKVFGCFDERKLVGICAYYRAGVRAELIQVYLKKEYQGLGIGNRLITYLIEFGKAAGIACLELEVAKNNAAAIRTYQSLGFVKREIPSNSIDNEELLFQLELN